MGKIFPDFLSGNIFAVRRNARHVIFHVLDNDKALLLSDRAWLNDRLIDKAQELLKHQFSYVGGLQSLLLGQTQAFAVEVGEFVQILHAGQSHWLTISTNGCFHPLVKVYDSLAPGSDSRLCHKVASLLVTNCASITLQYVDVMRQVGPSDCGLFAIAVTALASGNDPGQLFFDQSSMRHHLIKCIEAGCMSQFPVKKNRRRKMQELLLLDFTELF